MNTATLPSRSAAPDRGCEVDGPHQCIGSSFALLEATLVLAAVAQRYRLRLPASAVVTPHPKSTLRPAGGLPMLLDERAGLDIVRTAQHD